MDGTVAFRWNLFAICWAAAALFHVAGNHRPLWLPFSLTFTLVQVGVAVAALLVLVGYRRTVALWALCVLIPLSAWFEAPVVGNHWVLAAAVSLAYLVATVTGPRSFRGVPAGSWSRFAPTARLTLLVAYGFAAFAKLNTDFFDPAVSCAVYYQDQLVRSWGLAGLSIAGSPGLGVLVAIAAALTELSVVTLLLFTRTRRLGVVMGLSFHGLLALDFSQHFWDFSAVLFAGFLLFLDDAAVQSLKAQLSGLSAAVRPGVQRLGAFCGGLAALVVVVAAIVPGSMVLRGVAVLTGHVAWTLVGTAAVVTVGLALFRAQDRASAVPLRVPAVALLVPLLVFANGLTPYLEIKTGFGWNMYSNLQTVDGVTNHYAVRRTLDLTRLQSDRVQITKASDEALAPLIGADYEIVFSEFREYAHDNPEESVVYRRHGETFASPTLADDPAGRAGAGTISKRLHSYRVVDVSGAERCQAVFSPAR